jgi:hypothetical protein
MIVTYLWNVALAEALFPALQAVEIGLRNSISAGLTARYGTEEWYDQPQLLGVAQQRAVARAKGDVLAAKGALSAGRVIAELHFWFWTSLLSQPYHHPLWAPQQFALIDAVFPHVRQSQRNRRKLHQRFNAVRGLRNRVFHFEPLWNRSDLRQDHLEMLDALGWISPAMEATVRLIDRFNAVRTHGRAHAEQLVRAHLGI